MNTEKQYIQAFNNGYVLAQYEPDFSNILFQNLTPSNNYLKGFFSGWKQVELEKIKDHMFELQQLRHHSKIQEKDLGRE